MDDYTNRVFCFCCGKELTNSDDWVMIFVDKNGAPSLGFPGGGCSLDILFWLDIMKPKGKSRNWRKNEQ